MKLLSQYASKWLVSVVVLVGLIGMSTSPVYAISACSSVQIDNNTADWTNVVTLLTDGADITENYVYYNSTTATWSPAGTGWQTGDDWRVDLDRMMDIENVKTCNSAVELFALYDSYYPLLGLEPVDPINGAVSNIYYEFGDDVSVDGPGSTIGSPADWHKWIVFSMNNLISTSTGVESGDVYFYTIEFDMESGEVGVDPTDTVDPNASDDLVMQLWEDTDGSGTFHPNVDTVLLTFDSSSSNAALPPGAQKQYTDGALELDFDLLSTTGQDVFSVTGWNYTDYLEIAVSTYDDSYWATVPAVVNPAVSSASDSTSTGQYKIKKVGPRGLTVTSKNKTKKTVALKAEKVSGAKYKWQLESKKYSVLRNKKVAKNQHVFKKLESNVTYTARVRMKVGDTWTPYSERVKFKIK